MFVVFLITLAIAAAAYIRIAPVTPDPVDFSMLTLKTTPNQYLLCPPDYCKRAKADGRAGPFKVSSADLLAAWQEMLADKSRVRRASVSGEPANQQTYIARSKWMGFPDLITVEAVPLGDHASGLAVFSRSIYGRKDFGVNAARVKQWLAELKSSLAVK